MGRGKVSKGKKTTWGAGGEKKNKVSKALTIMPQAFKFHM
jgi:hypothetical protein